MFSSVRGRLIFNSVVISLTAIVSVGIVTLFLLEAYFTREERDYLNQQAGEIGPALSQALRFSNGSDLEEIAAILGFLSDLRIEILSADEQLLADSGRRGSYQLGDEGLREPSFGMIIDHNGNIVGFRPSAGNFVPFSLTPLEIERDSQITSISDTSLRLPLMRGNQLIGYLRLSEGPAVGQGVRQSVRAALLGGAAVALVTAIVVGSLSAQQVSRPLNALGQAAERMAANELDARAPTSDLREFNQLADRFNRMAAMLTGTIAQLREERELLRHTIADASHEMRTPLTALKTFNTLLQDEVESGPALEFIEVSQRQLNQLDQLTSNLLDLSRFDVRARGTDFVEADLSETVAEAVESVRPLAAAKQQTLQLRTMPQPLPYRHDPAALAQAVRNLVLNAVKNTAESGCVSVDVKGGDPLTISVSDNGSGITQDALPHIFKRFYRAPQASSDGSGLGLAIVQTIVDIHGGRIEVNTSVDQGSTFTLLLPANTQPD